MRKIVVVLVLLISVFSFPLCNARAEEAPPFDSTAKGKAAKEMLDALKTFFSDVKEMQNMTLEEKMNYVLTNGPERIKKKTTEMALSKFREQFPKFARAQIRLGILKEMSGKMIHDTVVDGKAINDIWRKYDLEIEEAFEARMKAFGYAMDAVEVGYAVYYDWDTKGAQEGIKTLKFQSADKIVGYMLPGWGYWRAAQDLVISLGEYVLSYAFDEAMRSKLNAIFPQMKSNPDEFARWVIDKKPAEIRKVIDDQWELVGDSGWWPGRATDSGHEKMKDEILAAVVGLRGGLAARKAEQEQQARKIEQRVLTAQQKAQEDEAGMKKLSAEVVADTEKALKVIDDFRIIVLGYQKKEAENRIKELNADMDAAPGGVGFVPINIGIVLSTLEAAYDYIPQDSVKQGQCDREKMRELFSQAMLLLNKSINEADRENAAIRKQAWDAHQASGGYKSESATKALFEACNGQMRKHNDDKAIAHKKIELLQNETGQRSAELSRKIDERIKDLSLRIAKLESEFIQKLEIIEQEKNKELHFKDLYRPMAIRPETAVGGGFVGLVEPIKEQTFIALSPGHIRGAFEALKANQENFRKDKIRAFKLIAREKQLFQAHMNDLRQLSNEFERLCPIPEMLLSFEPNGSYRPYDPENSMSAEMWGIASFEYFIPKEKTGEIKWPQGRLREKLEGLKIIEDNYNQADKLLRDSESVLRWHAQMDDLAINIMRMGKTLESRLKDFALYNSAKIEQSEAVRAFEENPALSAEKNAEKQKKAMSYLDAMKDAWAENSRRVEILKNLLKGWGKGIKYSDADPATYAAVAGYEGIPEKIKIWEKAIGLAKAEDEKMALQAKKIIEEYQQGFDDAALKNNPVLQLNAMKMFKVRTGEYVKILHLPSPIHYLIADEIVALDKQAEEFIKKKEKEAQEYVKKINAENEAAARRAEEERKRQREKERKESIKRSSGSLAGYYGFYISDPRLNNVSLQNKNGDIILTRDDLESADLKMTADFRGLENSDTIMISVDNGRTWKNMPKTKKIAFSFRAVPGEKYNLLLKAIANDKEEVILPVFSNITSFTYEDIRYNDLLAQSLSDLAKAYEQQNISAFSGLISRDYFGNKTFLEEGVRFDFDMFSDIELTIYVNRIEQRSGMWIVETKWDKKQMPRSQARQQLSSGKTTLMFAFEDRKMKIKNMRGNLLFATLSAEIAQANGLNQSVIDAVRTAYNNRIPDQPGAETVDGQENKGAAAGSSKLAVKTAALTITHGINQGFDLSSGNQSGVHDFEVEFVSMFLAFNGCQMQDVTGRYTFDDLIEAPDIVNEGGIAGRDGTVILIVTTEGYYAKLRIDSAVETVPLTTSVVRFSYAVQTDGTKDLATQ